MIAQHDKANASPGLLTFGYQTTNGELCNELVTLTNTASEVVRHTEARLTLHWSHQHTQHHWLFATWRHTCLCNQTTKRRIVQCARHNNNNSIAGSPHTETHLALQARRRDREVDEGNPRAQVGGEPRPRVSSDEQQQEVGAEIDVFRAKADQSAAAGPLQLAVEERVEHRVDGLHVLVIEGRENGGKPW